MKYILTALLSVGLFSTVLAGIQEDVKATRNPPLPDTRVANIQSITSKACDKFGKCDLKLKEYVTDYWLIKSYVVTNETRSDDDIANAVVYSAAVLNLNSKRIEALSYKLETAMLLTKDSRMKECVLDKALTAQLSEGSIKDFVKLKIVTCSVLLDNAYRKGS